MENYKSVIVPRDISKTVKHIHIKKQATEENCGREFVYDKFLPDSITSLDCRGGRVDSPLPPSITKLIVSTVGNTLPSCLTSLDCYEEPETLPATLTNLRISTLRRGVRSISLGHLPNLTSFRARISVYLKEGDSLPASLTSLENIRFKGDLQNFTFPPNLQKLRLHLDGNDATTITLPANLKELSIHPVDDSDERQYFYPTPPELYPRIIFPAALIHLETGYLFPATSFPSKLQHLICPDIRPTDILPSSLKTLEIYHCSIPTVGTTAFPASITQLTLRDYPYPLHSLPASLTSLTVWSNNIDIQILGHIIPTLASYTQLKKIHLDGNYDFNEPLTHLPPFLTHLSLGDNFN